MESSTRFDYYDRNLQQINTRELVELDRYCAIDQYNETHNTKFPSKFWCVDIVATHPDFQKKGYGRKLMNAVDTVTGHSLSYLEASVGREGFYEKCEYEKLFLDPHVVKDPEDADYGANEGFMLVRNGPKSTKFGLGRDGFGRV